MKIRLTKQKSITLTASNIIIASIIWQIVWVWALAAFQIREKLVYAGVFGPNCSGCQSQTTLSMIGIMTPLAIGAIAFSFGFISLLEIKNVFFRVLLLVTIASIIVYASFWVWVMAGFVLHYGEHLS